MGYFANAQYDVFFLYVILNDSEESHRKSVEVYALSLKSWDISLTLNMTYFFAFPEGESEISFTLQLNLV